ncbi:MAG: aminotransferase class I/II-fold pyridoxal phosphate-dependent enzyme [Gaiellaceae bacterium]
MDQRETPLADAAAAFLAAEITPFTTPGHKRVPGLADDLLLLDLPLSSGADDLHMRSDVLGGAQRLAAALWGADLCRFCANGSTQGNQALALALGPPGDPVVVARSLHKSVLAGLVLSGLDPVWVRPDVDPATGLPVSLPPARVAAALSDAPDACGVFLVEPSFVGVLSDVAAIAEVTHERGLPLVVDQAWGAHFGFHPDLPPHALAAGADGFVASAHKTLAAFTQSAYLLARRGFLDLERLDEALELLHTTSPSGALLASLDRARMIMATRGQELLGETLRLAAYARRRLAEVDGLVVADSDDPTKLALALPGTGADGLDVEADLFAQGIRFELANRDLLVPLLTIADTEAGVERLCAALTASIERRRAEPRQPGAASAVWDVTPETALTPREAFFSARETVRAEDAAGRVVAEMVAPYPPGIPAIAPGEVVSRELVEALQQAAAGGTRLAYCADPALGTLQVVARG